MTENALPSSPFFLINLSGPDAPGITAELTQTLAAARARIRDIGQAVIYGHLTLSILFDLPGSPLTLEAAQNHPVLKELVFRAMQRHLRLEYRVISPLSEDPVNPEHKPELHRYAVTLLAEHVSAGALHGVTAALAGSGFNIDLIQKLSEDEFSCVELLISTSTPSLEKQIKRQLLEVARDQAVDIALQREGLFRRSKRLVVFDLDSTLIQCEVIDEFAREMGVFEAVSHITERAMNGEIDFNESLALRVAQLKGLSPEQMERVYQRIQFTPGAESLIQTLRLLGYRTAIISGGFSTIAEKLRSRLGIDRVYANHLEIDALGNATGKVILPIVNAEKKAELLDQLAREEKINPEQVIAIGDGANDLLMLQRAGLGIAFNAKPSVREKAGTAINQKNLESILHLLGISKRDLLQQRNSESFSRLS